MTGKQRRRVAALIHRIERNPGRVCYVRGAGSYRVVRRAVDAGLVVAMVSKNGWWSSAPKELAVYLAADETRARAEYTTMMQARRRAR